MSSGDPAKAITATGERRPLGEIEVWIFDLDNTLYPAHCNLFVQVDERIRAYICRFLGVAPEEARALQKHYFREHGTTMNGLMLNHGMAPGEFLDYVHDIDVSPVPPSPELDAALGRLPGRKLIFTNGSVRHAENVLNRLGVAHHFEAIHDIVAAGYRPKPDPASYDAILALHRIDPRHAVLVEDMPRNLEPAHALGMTTVWLRCDHHWSAVGAEGPHLHYVIDDLLAWLNEVAPAGAATESP